jgi:hypothetical protein
MTQRLNQGRSFGTIHPPMPNGARFEQDGMLFDIDGELVDGQAQTSGAGKTAPKSAKPPKPQTKKTASPQATLEDAEDGEEDNGENDGDNEAHDDPDAVDLKAWARGKKNYPFFAVKRAFKDGHPSADVSKATAKSIVKALIDEGVVEEAEVER